MACLLGLDIGTTSTIGILIQLPGTVLGIASRPVTLQAPHAGWAEEDPEQWWANVCAIARELLAKAGPAAGELVGIGVSGMLPAVVLLDDKGKLLRPSIQQSDARCGAEVEAMRAERDEAAFLARAGNGINQQLVGAKLRWIEKHEPDTFRRIATVFGSYDYINWRLTGERAVEQNWALEGGFVDIARHEIDDELVGFAHIPRATLPPKTLSHAILGRVTKSAAQATGLPEGTPVVGGAADFIASALGAGLTRPGDVLLKFGGSIDVLIATDKARPDRRMYLDYHLVPGLFVPNGCMSTGGSGLNWFAATFAGGERAAAEAAGLTLHQHLDRLADTTPPGADGVRVLPYFLGEKTPIHDPDARGMIAGLSLTHGLGHLWRAMLEAYAYAIRHHVEVLNDMGHATERYLVSDGGANSRTWMQVVANVLQKPVQRLAGHPGSCLGAAWTAAIGTGQTADWSGVARFVTMGEVLRPDPVTAAVYAEGYRAFRDLYRRVAAPLAKPGAR
jgi:xylulokinase